MRKFLIIQTAFIGDVVLATAIIEKLYDYYPYAKIDFLLRKGNEGLLEKHPVISEILIWDKKTEKIRNLWSIIKRIRSNKYDYVINLHRFFSSGLITLRSGAKHRIGFDKNPLSLFYTQKYPHLIGNAKNSLHEVERNHQLIAHLTDANPARPRLYPCKEDYSIVPTEEAYICIAPNSVWFTKQLPQEKWIKLIRQIPSTTKIFLLGANSDSSYCDEIIVQSNHLNIVNYCGKTTFLQSVALMSKAKMNYVNDSAPLHFASATNAPVTAFFCSTTPTFGFGPLSDESYIKESQEELACRPCGLHGKSACPEGHFRCSNIDMKPINQSEGALS